MSASELRAAQAEFLRNPVKPGDQWAQAASKLGGELAVSRRFSEIKPEHLRWLWPGRIPLGKLTLLAGDPGLGKSLLTLDIAARVSTGARFPDGAACERGSVILLSAEDDPADTIRPRLDAAGADVSNVYLLEAVRHYISDGKSIQASFVLEGDIAALEELVIRTGARLLIVDPISAYLGGADSHSNSEVRGLLSPLAALAARRSVAALAVTHLRKSSGAAIYRSMGSLGFAAASRAVWGVAADPQDNARRLLLPVKQNLAPDGGGMAYRIEAPAGIARIAWESGTVTVDADILMGGFESREDSGERREAQEWLRDFLADGPQPASEVKRESSRAGLSWATVRRAADALGVSKCQAGFHAGWKWSLTDAQATDAHPIPTKMSTCANVAENTKDKAELEHTDAHITHNEHLCEASTRGEQASLPLKGETDACGNPVENLPAKGDSEEI